MYLQKIICASVLAAVITGSATAKDRPRSFELSVYNSYRSLPSNTENSRKTAIKVGQQFPGWSVTTDKISGAFTDIFGAPVSISGNTILDKAGNCLTTKVKASDITGANWSLIGDINARKADYVNFRQVVNGRPVVYSRLSFRFTKEGELNRIQMQSYDASQSQTKLSIGTEEAKQIVSKDLTDVNISNLSVANNWVWYPVPSAKGYTLHPAWHYEVEGNLSGSIPLDLTGYIDATDGSILERTNETKETSYDLTVKGIVYKNNTLTPPTPEAITDLILNIGPDTFYTDVNGQYSSSLISLPASTIIPLSGRWSTVIDSITGLMPVFTDVVTTGGTTYTYDTAAPSSIRHINAYYHVNRVHNFMKSHFTTFTKLDFSMPTNVDLVSGTCNAFYNKSKINFYKESPGCNSFAEIGDIIYHEYGHGISDIFYKSLSGSSMRNGSLNEACSDVWAMCITHDPILGQNAFTGGGYIRRYDQLPQVYPIDWETGTYADPHKNGQIIAGCWWDVAVNLGSVDSMANLFTDVYFDFPDGATGKEGTIFQSILIDALQADDDNGNLLDGTPHYNQIVAAFAKHGIYMEGDVKLTHNELTHQPPYSPMNVSAGLSMSRPTYFGDMTVNFRTNGGGAWTAIPMTAAGSTFTAVIPGQPQGTVVEYYFTVHDKFSQGNAFFPITCNPSLPADQMTIPYQFAVGVRAVEGTDFEAATPAGWLVGSNKGDDATGGLWARNSPKKNAIFNGWPVADHTTDTSTGKCLLTGNGSIGTFGQGVTEGTSTVLTPIFSISSFSIPIIEYYRWFSNEEGYSNFKNDPWIVKIRNSASASWTTVERTYQADDNWRRKIFRVSSYLPAWSKQVQLMFIASDSIITTLESDGQSTSIGALDDFFIYDQANTLETPSIPAARADVFPNPANDDIRVVLSSGKIGTIGLYDMMGKLVREVNTDANNSSYSIDTRDVAAGTYSLLIQLNGSVECKKIAVVHNN